jgi:hypothetical protein
MSGILQTLFLGAAAAVTDAFFNLVTLLLNTTATNGAQNNTFLDSSTNNFTITRNGNTTQGTFTPFSQTGWSNYFDGTGDYLAVTNNNTFDTNATFTFECWFWANSTASTLQIFSRGGGNTGTTWSTTDGTQFALYTTSSAAIVWQWNNAGTPVSISGGTVVANSWNHVAIGYNGTTSRLWLNGASIGTSTTAYTLPTTRNLVYVGSFALVGGSQPWNGYLSNLRFVKGTDVYGVGNTTFTVPTTPLTAITNTSLLTCQSNRFLDSSTNAFTITRSGDVSVQAFSPFAPTAAYDTAVVGGSGYFDGALDSLSVSGTPNAAFQFGTGNFTMECWLYSPTGLGSAAGDNIFDTRDTNTVSTTSAGVNFFNTGYLNVYIGSENLGSSTKIPAGSWVHVALVRNGSTATLYQNGVSVVSSSAAGVSNDLSNGYYRTGSWSGDGSFKGYMTNHRVVKGTAVYTANFTPPTAPLTAITNTQLLLNHTNAGIFDSTAKNVLETVGNAQVSTTQAKWGTTSMFLGSSGANKLFTTNIIPPQSGNFTLEMWIYPTSFVDFNTIFDSRTSDTDANGFVLGVNAAAKLYFYTNNAFALTATGTISANTWTHVALVRNGTGSGNIKIYINGTADATTATNTASFTRTSASIGDDWNTRSGLQYFGYADDIRISNFARYVSNFSVPTAAFPLQ